MLQKEIYTEAQNVLSFLSKFSGLPLGEEEGLQKSSSSWRKVERTIGPEIEEKSQVTRRGGGNF